MEGCYTIHPVHVCSHLNCKPTSVCCTVSKSYLNLEEDKGEEKKENTEAGGGGGGTETAEGEAGTNSWKEARNPHACSPPQISGNSRHLWDTWRQPGSLLCEKQCFLLTGGFPRIVWEVDASWVAWGKPLSGTGTMYSRFPNGLMVFTFSVRVHVSVPHCQAAWDVPCRSLFSVSNTWSQGWNWSD